LVLETVRTFNLQSAPLVRAIFRLRAMILGAKGPGTDWSRGFVEELLQMGWGVLAEEKDRWLAAGAVCQPWLADVLMTPIPSDRFAAYCEPGQVKIIWTLEAEPLDDVRCRFSTETRAVGTDAKTNAKFRSYYRRFGVGMVLVRWLLLPAVRREAERRWRALLSTPRGIPPNGPSVLPRAARKLALIVYSSAPHCAHHCLTSELCSFIFIMNTFEEA
jgi:hypothetical protein